MEQLFYSIEVRDKNGKLYKTESGGKVHSFKFESVDYDESIIKVVCKETFEEYQAICKEGSDINIEVSYFNSISSSYSLLYSFYGAKNKFIKH